MGSKRITKNKRVLLIGLDALTPTFLERFIEEGALPAFEDMMRKSFYCEVLPVFPPATAQGWTSIATGANPGTHGITDMAIHLQGEPLNKKHIAFDTKYLRAETIWEAAERQKKRVILLKYPISWPKVKNGILVEGDGSPDKGDNMFELAPSKLFTTLKNYIDAIQISLSREPNLKNKFSSKLDPLGATIIIESKKKSVIKRYKIYLIAPYDSYEEVIVTEIGNPDRIICKLGRRSWSQWIIDKFYVNGTTKKGAFKFKVLELSRDGQYFSIYLTQIFPVEGYTLPRSVGKELYQAAGPIIVETDPTNFYCGWYDLETQLEIYRIHTEQMKKYMKYLLTHKKWDLFMMQWHPIDYAQHICWGKVDETHPLYDPKEADDYWSFLRNVYQLADSLVNEGIRSINEDNTYVLVVGDHGHAPVHTYILLNNFFEKEGLLVMKKDPKTGLEIVDWSKTKVYGGGVFVYINLKGREPNGIVDKEEYDELREEIIDMLYELKDPKTGKHPISIVLKKEEAEYFGLYGDRVGDIIVATKLGYALPSTPGAGWAEFYGKKSKMFIDGYHLPLVPGERRIFVPAHEMSSGHGSFLPIYRSMHTVLFIYGPDIRKHTKRRLPVRLIDIAPTIAYMLGISPPIQNEGSIILDAFE